MAESILLLVVGGILGFASSYFTWKVQNQNDKKTIAHAFYKEISSLEDGLKVFKGMLFAAPPPGFSVDNYMPSFEQSFFSDILFHSFKKEISSFDNKLSNALYDFYLHLLRAEEYRKLNLSKIEHPQLFKVSHDAMKKELLAAWENLPQTKMLLERAYSKWIF